MAALLVGLGVMAILMSVALPVWRTAARREKEAELVFRGEQYARAVALFQRKFAGAYPPSIDVLVEQRFLRRKYKDPITGDDFQPLMQASQVPGAGAPGVPGAPGAPGPGGAGRVAPPSIGARPTLGRAPGPTPTSRTGPGFGPQVGIVGVTSKSTEKSIKLYRGRGRYNEWAFVYMPATTAPGAPGTAVPGQGRPGTARPGGPAGSPAGPRPFTPGSGPQPMRPPGSSPF
jgi:type II secretory pathway pseudopilin PulG